MARLKVVRIREFSRVLELPAEFEQEFIEFYIQIQYNKRSICLIEAEMDMNTGSGGGSVKKAITFRLCVVIITAMAVTALLGYFLQTKSAKEAMGTNSEIRFNQIAEVLDRNNAEIEELRENLKEDYFIRAKAAAYIIQNHPEVERDLEEVRKIASLLQVDELHLFNKEGLLYAGSEPKYYDYTFHSGEQMEFFLPMLDDYSLQLCQEVTPNTAEGKMMQYVAVWREDHQGIIQIGMEPERLMTAMEKNELSYIFSMMTTENGVTLFAADPETEAIVGATDGIAAGTPAETIGLDLERVPEGEKPCDAELFIDGEKNYCILQRVGGIVVGVSASYDKLYENVPGNMKLIIFSLFLLSCVAVFLILRMLDRFILCGIRETITGTQKIAAGNLDYRLTISQTPEFKELSANINRMVKSLLEATGKLSLVFQNVDIPIAVYEYNEDMRRVLATKKLGEILLIPDEELNAVLADHTLLAKKIEELCSVPLEEENDIYILEGKERRYVKIKSYEGDRNTLGIVIDMTETIVEKHQIEQERDIDLLTGLYTRRAFFRTAEQLFADRGKLKTAMLLMMDLDNLKFVNDTWGHEYGDLLLKAAAGLFDEAAAPEKVAARLSGDEFVLLLYGADSAEELEGCLAKLEARIEEARLSMPGGKEMAVSVSGGYLIYPETDGSCEKLLHLADQAMYRVKKSGKGRFEKYTEGESV